MGNKATKPSLPPAPKNHTYKITFVGDTLCGKSSLFISYLTNRFPDSYIPCVCDPYEGKVHMGAGLLSYSLWDTSGNEEWKALRELAYADSDLFVILYDITNPQSFDNVKEKWWPELGKHFSHVRKILLGTKIDLRHDSKLLQEMEAKKTFPKTKWEGEELAREIGAIGYVECSALSKEGEPRAFNEFFEYVKTLHEAEDPSTVAQEYQIAGALAVTKAKSARK